MFLGEYEYNIDDKNRLAIPARFREELGEGVVITRGFDGCLFGFPRPFWEILAQQVATLSFGAGETRQLQRMLFSGAAELEFDKQGRVVLPPNLRESAQLAEAVVLAGVNKYFEIWNPQRWEQQLENLDANGSLIAQQLQQLTIQVG